MSVQPAKPSSSATTRELEPHGWLCTETLETRVGDFEFRNGYPAGDTDGQPLPSVSSYINPKINADGSVDIFFGPHEPMEKGNWIQTVPGRGWFPIFRFYGPAEPFFDKTWKLPDIEQVT